MQLFDYKKHDETNMYYGVDLNDKKAVEKEYNKRRRTHSLVTMIMIVILAVLGVIIFDFVRVYFYEGTPMFAVSKDVVNGRQYDGLGYSVLVCDNGERYVAAVLYKDCTGEDGKENTLQDILYNKLLDYTERKKILDKGNLESLTINEYIIDEGNDLEGTDYYMDITVQCKNGTDCFKTTKPFNDPSHIQLFLRIDRYTEVFDLVYFKTSGEMYNRLVERYKTELKDFLIKDGSIDEANLKHFGIRIIDDNGAHEHKGTKYAGSYLIQIGYTCMDDSNTCVKYIDKEDTEGDYTNLSYLAAVFVDEEGNIQFVGHKEYLGL